MSVVSLGVARTMLADLFDMCWSGISASSQPMAWVCAWSTLVNHLSDGLALECRNSPDRYGLRWPLGRACARSTLVDAVLASSLCTAAKACAWATLVGLRLGCWPVGMHGFA